LPGNIAGAHQHDSKLDLQAAEMKEIAVTLFIGNQVFMPFPLGLLVQNSMLF
jgi:hypothetical protein